jgi:hypothetical protein
VSDPLTIEQAKRLGIRLPGMPKGDVGASRPGGRTGSGGSPTRKPVTTPRRDREVSEQREGTPAGARNDSGRPTSRTGGTRIYHSPCGGCGKDNAYGRPYCVPCATKAADRFAAAWVPLLVASMAMNGGQMPEIDPALQRKPKYQPKVGPAIYSEVAS